jgi:hypothetical protein
VDLQLADIKSCELRGEDAASRLRRLSPYLPRNEVRVNASLYSAVQKLAGLEQAVREHKVDVAQEMTATKGR